MTVRAAQWYPKAEQPKKTYESVVLKIHVGRNLLGFHGQPDRRKYLATDRPRPTPQQIITAYERLMAEAASANPKQQTSFPDSWSLSSRHFDAYVDAMSEVNGTPKPETVIAVYGRFLQIAEQAEESIRNKAYDGVLAEKFHVYVDALVSRGRLAEIGGLIELFARLGATILVTVGSAVRRSRRGNGTSPSGTY